ncbi:hypothetical protein [Allonocardiopsis opalescens]|uniref:Uncharacterized protein n=1 Tax=Allonocardiopsis opalescens TaxID=1144618 RepID=A0A2T0PW99_9ACTN|nr:hypothetical protein [Allonocardiopsis opalescens]PRX95787.1 hypothetical protein CLV72_109401 [Allonocardiopsis opalescens]
MQTGNGSREPLGGFEERLLGELRGVVAARAEAAAEPAASGRRFGFGFRPRLALVGGAAVATVGLTAGAFALGGLGAAPAYAVEPQPDGSITVEVAEPTDAEGLERALAEHGVRAEVDHLPAGMVCQEGRFEPAPPPGDGAGPVALGMETGSDGSRFTITEGMLRPGETLVLTSRVFDGGGWGLSMAIAQGEVAPCDPREGEAEEGELPAPVAPGESGTGAGGSESVVERGTESVGE